jgi:2,3-bisphosphoglycerate-independent phosphoglycerate mutase
MAGKNSSGVVLAILDGWGLSDNIVGNAIAQARTLHFDELWNKFPHAQLECSGESVGLPVGQMGTSEVNHLTIGVGRVIFQDLVRINNAIKDNTFYQNPAFLDICKKVRSAHSSLHIMGLVSDGGVHSHIDHLFALLTLAKRQKLKRVYIHVFTDGRDTPPKSALADIEKLEGYIKKLGIGEIATVSGRYFAMDRDNNWERTDKTMSLLSSRTGKQHSTALKLIQDMYINDVTDEFIAPSLIRVKSEKHAILNSDDGVVFFNFRSDRPRQLMQRLLHVGQELSIVTMTRYHPEYPVEIAFAPVAMESSLGEILGESGIKQIRITETEKFAHLSYFLNCKVESPYDGEDRKMYNSHSDISTHDQKPEMRTPDIAQSVVKAIRSHSHSVIFTNICNCDMVGHTGNIPATIAGVEATDIAVGAIAVAALKHDYAVIVTADHGNAEEMIDKDTGQLLTSHTTNPVPFILVSNKYKKLTKKKGSLIDIAPTILTLLGLRVPSIMTGKSFV